MRKIGAYGRGPGEYTGASSYWIDEKGKTIYIVPIYNEVINKYSYDSGEYLGSIGIKNASGKTLSGTKIGMTFSMPHGKIVAISPRSTFRDTVAYLYSELNTEKGILSPYRQSYQYGLNNLGKNYGILGALSIFAWYDSQNRVNYWEPMNDTSYFVNPDFSSSPRLILDYGSRKLDYMSLLQTLKIDPSKILWNHLWESPLYLFFEFSYQDKFYFFTYNKMDGRRSVTRILPKSESKDKKIFFGLFNDIDGGLPSMGTYDKDLWFTSYEAVEMINHLTPEHFEEVRSRVKYPDRMEKLQKLVAGLQEEDNPVIVIAHLKHLID